MATNIQTTVRTATPADTERLSLIGASTFLETFAGILHGEDIVKHCREQHSPTKYISLFENQHTRAWLAEYEGAPVGYVLLTEPDLPVDALAPSDLEIKRIYLLSKFQGTGIGARLLKAALQHAKHTQASRLFLGVYAENSNAIGFYKRFRFEPVNTRQFHVGNRTYDDLVMCARI